MQQIILNDKILNEHAHEQSLILDFLEDIPRGFFVDVGTNMPIALNQTYALEQLGWEGILIEPQTELLAEIEAKRTSKLYNVACGSANDTKESMTLYLNGGQSSLIPGTTSHINDYHGEIKVPVMTLDAILIEQNVRKIDFLSIDVEGFELQVLQGFSIDRYQPKLILIEDHVRNLVLHRYLTRKNYKLIRRTFLNNWYIPCSTPYNLPWRNRLKLFRKMYLGTPVRNLKKHLQDTSTN